MKEKRGRRREEVKGEKRVKERERREDDEVIEKKEGK